MGLRLWSWSKTQSSQWNSPESPCPKKAPPSRSNFKIVMTGFSGHEDVVHHDYSPPGQIITKEYYIEVLRRLIDTVRRKLPQFWASGDRQLHHDNAPAHSTVSCRLFWLNIASPTTVSLLPSPHLAVCDLWLFPKLQSPLKGRRFVNATVTQYTSSVKAVSLPTDSPHWSVTVHGCTVRSPLTGCQVTSSPHDQFSRYSKWTDTFQTALVCVQPLTNISITQYVTCKAQIILLFEITEFCTTQFFLWAIPEIAEEKRSW